MSSAPTERTRLRRLPKRGSHERATIEAILDEAFLCHLGFVVDGRPVVVPTLYGRAGETLFLHGLAASRARRAVAGDELDVCVEVTLLDGLVLARSAVNHSVNYRSVVIYGRAAEVTDPALKRTALRAFSEHVVPGRWDDVRPPTAAELKATGVLSLSLAEASAKVRSGQPSDDPEDYLAPTWAGVVPLETVAAAPVPDPRLGAGADPVPAYAASYVRPGGATNGR